MVKQSNIEKYSVLCALFVCSITSRLLSYACVPVIILIPKLISLLFFRPYYVKSISHTNLLLIVVRAMFSSCPKDASTEFVELEYPDEEEPRIPSCIKHIKQDLNNLKTYPRRRLAGCYNSHPQVYDTLILKLSL